jgi:hypothetical protein
MSVRIEHPSAAETRAKRDGALAVLGMTLEQARAQWDDCGCCLINLNWDDLEKLEEVKDCDYLLGDSE